MVAVGALAANATTNGVRDRDDYGDPTAYQVGRQRRQGITRPMLREPQHGSWLDNLRTDRTRWKHVKRRTGQLSKSLAERYRD
jgi:hypothetical protein